MNTFTTLPRRSHRTRAIVLTGAAAGVALVIGAPLAASAHVHVDPGSASAGATATLTFASSHGCDGSPTTAFEIEIPDGVGNATPIVQGGWTITRELGTDSVPTGVTFTADTPVEDGFKAEFAMDVLFDQSAAGTTVAFPVTQLCAEGENAWTEIAGEGEDPHDLESPAPVVAVGEAEAEADGHAHAAGADDARPAASSTEATADPIARWLAAGGLVAGIAALIVVLVRGRARKA
ncbi:nuclear export factor GLE1 [Microbacterium sp. Root166]|uniref:YcnI family copper-binding membrane protein n=1 Tax=Microbacterium sp. Root166 TaxID=1736478 RepID=UPI0006FACC30|nr:YcnI family protein [Microbacterium sp. Root166]KQZ82209.1 nuclear export factor GLE1 [Microbacterium sp. Root166]